MSRNQNLAYTVQEYGDVDANKVVFLFCPFSVQSWQLALPGLPIWRLTKAGYRVIAYSYSLSIATVSPQYTLTAIAAILTDTDERIKQLGSSIQISCYGTSMGAVFAANVAARHARVQKVVLNLCYPDIAEHITNLPPMFLVPPKRLSAYIAAGNGLDGLREIFKQYAPINLVDNLRDKQVLLYLSRNDRLHQYRHTKKLLLSMRDAGANVTYYENNHLGHYFAALKNHLAARRYMRFLG